MAEFSLISLVTIAISVFSLGVSMLAFHRGSTRVNLSIVNMPSAGERQGHVDHIQIVNKSHHSITIRQLGYVRVTGEFDQWKPAKYDEPVDGLVDARATRYVAEPIINGVHWNLLLQHYPSETVQRGCYMIDGAGTVHVTPCRFVRWSWRIGYWLRKIRKPKA